MNTLIRRLVPYTLLPLSLVACVLANTPWLRAFPADVMAVPLFGAAVLSVLTPLIVVGIGIRRLWLTALIDLVLFVFYELLVTLREPAGFHDLYTGLVHGPAQILSFALPLVTPRTLLVAPVALCWLSGALVGECVARGWHSVLPYLTLMVTFGLSYAGTVRAVSSSADGRRYDTLFAAGLLLALLLLRAAQSWVVQDESAEITQPEGILPLRALAVGAVLSIAVAAGAAGLGQSSAFAGKPVTPSRMPPLDEGRPLTPVSFVADLRPDDPKSKGAELFTMRTDRPGTNYVALAGVDYYDGDGWTFSRTFRPSGGVIPEDTDPAMRTRGAPVTQRYRIDEGPMTSVPWMPHIERAQRVTGVSIDIDSTTGMIVPARPLRAGDEYTVTSSAPHRTFDQLGGDSFVGTSASQVDTTLASGLIAPLGTLVTSLEQETGTSSAQPVAFLQAVAQEFRTKSSLAAASTDSPTAAPSATPPPTAAPSSPPPTTTAHIGGTTFADVLASIRAKHAATPEQFATLMALIARKLNVPAEVVSGFRIPLPTPGRPLPAGTYSVTAADAWTWVEIPIRGQGWVVLDPSPGTYTARTPPTAAATPAPTPRPTPSSNALVTHSNGGGHAVAPPSRASHEGSLSILALVVIGAVVLFALAALLVVFLLARKQHRVRRRRGRDDPRGRLLGAWQESLDVLVEAGLPSLACATSAEVVAATGERFGAEPAMQAKYVGEAANVAIFSPTTAIGGAQADAAWRAQVQLSRAVRGRLGWRDRINARLRYNRPTHRRRTSVPHEPRP